MARWVPVGPLRELPPGAACSVLLDGWRVALANVDGQVFALDGVCPHMGGPLGDGVVQGQLLVCPWHAWRFDVTSGVAPSLRRVQVATYPVRVVDGTVEVEVPA